MAIVPTNADRGFTTHDSGARQEFESGMRRDVQEGKPRFDLTRPEGEPLEETMHHRLAMLMARGAEKYGDRNWELADSQDELDRAYASLDRHFEQFRAKIDDGEDHAAAIEFNLMEIAKLERLRREGKLKPRTPKITAGTIAPWPAPGPDPHDLIHVVLVDAVTMIGPYWNHQMLRWERQATHREWNDLAR